LLARGIYSALPPYPRLVETTSGSMSNPCRFGVAKSHEFGWMAVTQRGSVGGMTPGRVKRLEGDDIRDWLWHILPRLGQAGIEEYRPGRHISRIPASTQECRLSRNTLCNMPTYIMCRPNQVGILCRNKGRPDYPIWGRWSGIQVRDMTNGYIRGHRSQPKGHIPTIKEKTFSGMGEIDTSQTYL
jgi:hypothetical protein